MLKKGDRLPSISLLNQDGEAVNLLSLIGNTPLVVYFYPKNNTPGCTAEACSFRDNYTDFQKLGATVIGISRDSVASHKKVVENRKLPFTLLSDSDKKAERAFGVKRDLFGLLPGRVTFIFNTGGFIVDVFSSATKPKKHVTTSLQILKKTLK